MPDLNLFHFIRPWALLLIIPALILYWFYQKHSSSEQGWSAIIDQHLLQWIMPRSSGSSSKSQLPLLLLTFWVFASLALAGPTWTKTPQPVFSSQATQVILLDLSLSMDSNDIKPSRLKRAKFKIKDYLKLSNEGLTGLVVYAGDGFILSPLTSDTDTIENLLNALTVNIMPILGTKPERGFKKAIDLLDNSGLAQGKILWFTDGAEQESLDLIAEQLDDTSYQLNILAVGTEDGAPIKLSDKTGFLRDRNGNIVIPQLDYARMKTFAQKTGAVLTPVTADKQDVTLLAQASSLNAEGTVTKDNKFADSWYDLGFWLILLLLPIVLLSFKHRALLGCVCLIALGTTIPSPVQANPIEDLFLNQDQQAKQLLNDKNYTEAYNTFDNKRWKALSAYRMGSYSAAQNLIDQLPQQKLTADDYYNQGNALALNGDYEQAIAAYDKAIQQEPNHEDAQYNKELIEQLKRQKEKEQQQQNKNKEGDSKQQNQDQKKSDQKSDQESKQEDQKSQQESEKDQQQQEKQNQEKKQQEPKLTEEQLKEQFKEEEKEQEMEQWLRRLPDDPGGLLRRKMYREYQKRGHKQHVEKNW